jgi:hypothetical protein
MLPASSGLLLECLFPSDPPSPLFPTIFGDDKSVPAQSSVIQRLLGKDPHTQPARSKSKKEGSSYVEQMAQSCLLEGQKSHSVTHRQNYRTARALSRQEVH